MISYLKVKVCTLAAESKCIKVQQRHWKKRAAAARAREKDENLKPFLKSEATIAFAEQNFFGLRQHRVGKGGVQKEARDSNIAYGFLRNRTYSVIEKFAYTKPNWENIERMVRKFGGEDNRDVMQRFSAWMDAAGQYAEGSTIAHTLIVSNKPKLPHLPGKGRPAAEPDAF